MHLNFDKLDELPKRIAMHRYRRDGTKKYRCVWCNKKHSGYVSYCRVRRWLLSRVGRNISSVVHEFCRLDWLPIEKRTYHFLCDFVEVNTFKDGKTIKFYQSHYYSDAEGIVGDCWQEIFYVHPVTGLLCHKPQNTRVRYSKKQAQEMASWFVKIGDYDQLIKLDGIWYHVFVDMKWMKTARPVHRYDPSKPLLYPEPIKKRHFFGPFDSRWQEYYLFRPPVEKKQLSHEALKAYKLRND